MRAPSRLLQLMSFNAAVLCLLHSAGGPTSAHAQVIVRPARLVRPHWRRPYHWGYYNVADVISSRVHAQAKLIRASGAAILDIESAKLIGQERISKQIDNWLKKHDAQIEVRNKRRVDRLKRRRARPFDRIEDQLHLNSAVWLQLKYLPEMNYSRIPNGSGLNLLLGFLKGTVLSYKFSNAPGSDPKSRSKFVGLELTKEHLDNLNLIQRAGKGKKGNVFKASSGIGLNVEWYPWELRQKRFDVHRKQFERARQNVIAEAKRGAISVGAITALDSALLKFRTHFFKHFTPEVRLRDGNRGFQKFNSAQHFLRGLVGEVGRLRRTRDARAFSGKFAFEGDNLIDLLMYMSQRGFAFAPATPGREDTYHAVFKMMRDVYCTVEDRDPALRKKPRE